MSKKITIKDLSKIAGVSVASVHRALNGSEGVSKELRDRICSLAKEYDYQLNESAALLRRKSVNITVILPKAAGNERYYYRGIWKGIYDKADTVTRRNVSVNYIQSEGFDDIAGKLKELCLSKKEEYPDGIITCCDDEETVEWISHLLEKGVRISLIDRTMVIPGLTCMVETSYVDMGRIGITLCELFQKETAAKIYVMCGIMAEEKTAEYQSAVKEKEKELKLKSKPHFMKLLQEEETRNAVKTIMEKENEVIFMTNSARTTFWVCDEIKKCQKKGKVIGVDAFPELMEFFEKEILCASLYQSHQQYGSVALQYLLDQLIDSSVESNIYLPQPISIVMKDNYKYFVL